MPTPRGALTPVAEEEVADTGPVVLEPWASIEAGAAEDEGMAALPCGATLDFISAPVAGSVVDGPQRRAIVGLMIWWAGSNILRRYGLPQLEATPEAPLQVSGLLSIPIAYSSLGVAAAGRPQSFGVRCSRLLSGGAAAKSRSARWTRPAHFTSPGTPTAA